MNLIPDYTLVITIILFLALWQGLKQLMFDPVGEVLDRREQKTTGTLESAEAMRVIGSEAQGSYEAALYDARGELNRESEVSRKAAHAESTLRLEAARERAGEQLARGREEANRQIDAARQTLRTQARGIADQMVDRIVREARP